MERNILTLVIINSDLAEFSNGLEGISKLGVEQEDKNQKDC